MTEDELVNALRALRDEAQASGHQSAVVRAIARHLDALYAVVTFDPQMIRKRYLTTTKRRRK